MQLHVQVVAEITHAIEASPEPNAFETFLDAFTTTIFNPTFVYDGRSVVCILASTAFGSLVRLPAHFAAYIELRTPWMHHVLRGLRVHQYHAVLVHVAQCEAAAYQVPFMNVWKRLPEKLTTRMRDVLIPKVWLRLQHGWCCSYMDLAQPCTYPP